MADHSMAEKVAFALKEAGENGILLTCGKNANAMTIGWVTAGVMWGKDVICVPVRKSRYSHELLEGEKAFTVFIPEERNSDVTMYFGTVSGRNENKLEKMNYKAEKSSYVDAPEIKEKGSVIHAEILYKIDMTEENMTDAVKRWYPDPDLHTLYFAEIKALTKN